MNVFSTWKWGWCHSLAWICWHIAVLHTSHDLYLYLSSCNECLFHLKVGLMPDFNPNLPACPNCPMYLQEGQPYTFITQLVGQANFPFVSLLYLNLFTFVFWFLYWQKLWPNIQINHLMHMQIDGSWRKLRGQEGDKIFWHLKHPRRNWLKWLS